jgi:hypothetical protein
MPDRKPGLRVFTEVTGLEITGLDITGLRLRNRLTKPFSGADAVVPKQLRGVLGRANEFGGRVMSTLENDRAQSEGWDPALWSIGTALGVAILYVACLV